MHNLWVETSLSLGLVFFVTDASLWEIWFELVAKRVFEVAVADGAGANA
jgi:hypothetical protein